MSAHTRIEWSEATWNTVTGCTRVSPGCDHCYIERTPPFRIARRTFDKPGTGGTTDVRLHPERLSWPLRWRKPRRIFVNSLADLFHDDVPDGFIAAMWFIMGQSAGCIPEQYRGHTFQILTKRPGRMRAWLRKWADVGDPAIPPMDPAAKRCGRAELIDAAQDVFAANLSYDWMDGPRYWPTALPGVWLGVSVETQKWADIRVPVLLDTPAAVRFVSCEPLLGPVDLTWCAGVNALDVDWVGGPGYGTGAPHPLLDWVIAGGESGPGARPMHPDWARSLRNQCEAAAEVPFFFKQWGESLPLIGHREFLDLPPAKTNRDWSRPFGDDVTMCRVGKKVAGRDLDGRTWDEYPQHTHASAGDVFAGAVR